jgi:hypothetical protein
VKYHLFVFTDGRTSFLQQTLDSFYERVYPLPNCVTIFDDSQDPVHQEWVDTNAPEGAKVVHYDSKKGFCGTIQTAWMSLCDCCDWIFHLEDDFIFNANVSVPQLVDVLQSSDRIFQVALKRQPVNDIESRAGDLCAMWPDEYTDFDNPVKHTVHNLFWTTNPSMYGTFLAVTESWPDGPGCERKFHDQLQDKYGAQYAFMGHKTDSPKVHHIGSHRAGTGY